MGIWAISPLTGSVRKLRDDAFGALPSPDGSRIAFLAAAETEVWVMGSNGENAHRVAGPEPGARFLHVDWTPDGRRVAWIKRRENDDPVLETCEPEGGPRTSVFADARLRLSRWMPDNSIVLALAEPPPGDNSHNLWDVRVDSRLRVRGRPRRLTNWVGTSFLHLSATADGQRLAFVRARAVTDIYIADLDKNGDGLKNRRRFTAVDRANWPSAWTQDSQAVVFHSDRNGDFDIFRQALSSSTPEILASGRGEQFQAQFGPDQTSLLYLEWDPERQDTGRLMRAPSPGEPAQALFALSGRPISPQREHTSRSRLSTNVYPSFRCPSRGAGYCVIGEVQRDQVVFTAFDPGSGARREILKTGADPRNTFWDLSPDGARIAFGKRERLLGKVTYLRIVSVADGSATEVPAKDQAYWDGVGWAADGKSLFVPLWQAKGGGIVHANLDGRTTELYRTIGWADRPVASPDGRRLAFTEINYDSNVWMLEHFR